MLNTLRAENAITDRALKHGQNFNTKKDKAHKKIQEEHQANQEEIAKLKQDREKYARMAAEKALADQKAAYLEQLRKERDDAAIAITNR